MPEDQELLRFAELLIHLVRDRAIIDCDNLATGEALGLLGERWRGLLSDTSARNAINALIPDIVDITVAQLLSSLDSNRLPLEWRREDNSRVAMADLGQGEMEGWLMGPDGWRHSFAEQRFYDLFAGREITSDNPGEREDS
jgi:hypothetical protein